jgi:hypothetical protein
MHVIIAVTPIYPVICPVILRVSPVCLESSLALEWLRAAHLSLLLIVCEFVGRLRRHGTAVRRKSRWNLGTLTKVLSHHQFPLYPSFIPGCLSRFPLPLSLFDLNFPSGGIYLATQPLSTTIPTSTVLLYSHCHSMQAVIYTK